MHLMLQLLYKTFVAHGNLLKEFKMKTTNE
jgi:hypothetical protein